MIGELGQAWKQTMLDVLWPEHGLCLRCGRYCRQGELCPVCREDLDDSRMPEDVCPRCGGILAPDRSCTCGLPDEIICRSVWRYDGPAGQLVRMLKFHQTALAARPLAEGMADLAAPLLPGDVSCVTWITMPASRRVERTYDHAACLARTMAEKLDLPCRQLLVRPADVKHQVGLNGEERRRNLQGTFVCHETLTGTVLLVDDVFTTGATMRTAAQILLDAGAARVLAVTAVRAALDR